ncbi:hypothetical protein F0562_010243 [Nyssa sinensis]|uniref:RRM domain-containing protein n=1 Tax=Nyssa sinensis TaxID=561372 RepID=A0A5J5A010_9ASTE|nr:hypothetical protein F0562_010243 [Nyssa sinensis]
MRQVAKSCIVLHVCFPGDNEIKITSNVRKVTGHAVAVHDHCYRQSDKLVLCPVKQELLEFFGQDQLIRRRVRSNQSRNEGAKLQSDVAVLYLSCAASEGVLSGSRVRLVNLPKKKNIHRDLQLVFKGVPGIINIIPAVSGNKKTKDPICKGLAFVDFKSEDEANRAPMDEDDLTDKILDSLGDDYKEFIRAVQARDTTIMFDELHEKLLNFEASLHSAKSKPSHFPASANPANRNPTSWRHSFNSGNTNNHWRPSPNSGNNSTGWHP